MKWAVVMSEFAPQILYLVISLLVSLISLGLTAFALVFHLFHGVRHFLKYVCKKMFDLECFLYFTHVTSKFARKLIFWMKIFFLLFLIVRIGCALISLCLITFQTHVTSLEVYASGWDLSAIVNPPEVPGTPEPEPFIPVLYSPLITDETREYQLYNRLSVHAAFRPHYTSQKMMDIIEIQMAIEKRIEAGLVTDGLHPHFINGTRDAIRGVLFYPHGTPLSLQTYHDHLLNIKAHGTLDSLPFRRVKGAIQNLDIILRSQ